MAHKKIQEKINSSLKLYTSLMSFSSNVNKFHHGWLDFGGFKILMTLFKATQHSKKAWKDVLGAWILHNKHHYLLISQEWCLHTNQIHKYKQHSLQFLNHGSRNSKCWLVQLLHLKQATLGSPLSLKVA